MFEHEDLTPEETAMLALEHVRARRRWLIEAADAGLGEEEGRVLAAAAATTKEFAERLEMRLREHLELDVRPGLSSRLRRRSDIVSLDGDDQEVSAHDLLEVASVEAEEALQFFLERAAEQDDDWLRGVFEEIADHDRTVLLYLEAEREAVMDREGA